MKQHCLLLKISCANAAVGVAEELENAADG